MTESSNTNERVKYHFFQFPNFKEMKLEKPLNDYFPDQFRIAMNTLWDQVQRKKKVHMVHIDAKRHYQVPMTNQESCSLPLEKFAIHAVGKEFYCWLVVGCCCHRRFVLNSFSSLTWKGLQT